jgi:hypothetical protein
MCDTATVLVLDRAMGGSLAALVRARGALDPGEVVTVLSPLAGALADLHERGVVHGDVAPGNVLFDDLGRPLLGDLGLATVIGAPVDGDVRGTPGYADPARAAGGPPTPASDVHGLAAVAWLAVTGRAPDPADRRAPLVAVAPHLPVELALLLEAALDVDPDARPTARELAVRAFDAVPPEPVRLVPTDPAAAPAEVVTHRLRTAAAAASPEPPATARRRHRLGRRLPGPRVTALAGLVGLAAAVAGAVAVPQLLDGERPAAAQPVAVQPVAGQVEPAVPQAVDAALRADDPVAAVPALAWLRARALGTGSREPLARADAPGSPALAADLARLDELGRAGMVLDGVGFDVRDVQVVSVQDETAVVDATVVTLAHRQVGPAGEVVAEVPAGEPRTSRLTLRRGPDGWQVQSVT